ncbi:unnamed protein product [Urochloa humidicola]
MCASAGPNQSPPPDGSRSHSTSHPATTPHQSSSAFNRRACPCPPPQPLPSVTVTSKYCCRRAAASPTPSTGRRRGASALGRSSAGRLGLGVREAGRKKLGRLQRFDQFLWLGRAGRAGGRLVLRDLRLRFGFRHLQRDDQMRAAVRALHLGRGRRSRCASAASLGGGRLLHRRGGAGAVVVRGLPLARGRRGRRLGGVLVLPAPGRRGGCRGRAGDLVVRLAMAARRGHSPLAGFVAVGFPLGPRRRRRRGFRRVGAVVVLRRVAARFVVVCGGRRRPPP